MKEWDFIENYSLWFKAWQQQQQQASALCKHQQKRNTEAQKPLVSHDAFSTPFLTLSDLISFFSKNAVHFASQFLLCPFRAFTSPPCHAMPFCTSSSSKSHYVHTLEIAFAAFHLYCLPIYCSTPSWIYCFDDFVDAKTARSSSVVAAVERVSARKW